MIHAEDVGSGLDYQTTNKENADVSKQTSGCLEAKVTENMAQA